MMELLSVITGLLGLISAFLTYLLYQRVVQEIGENRRVINRKKNIRITFNRKEYTSLLYDGDDERAEDVV